MNAMTLIRSVAVQRAAMIAGLGLLAGGCASEQFYANYYVDPKPPHVAHSDLKKPSSPKPVYLVFDMYSAEGSFPEATRKIGPKVARVLQNSRLFSNVSSVGSENIPRLQLSMRETAVLTGHDAKSLPEGLTSGLSGSRGAIVYQFTAQYQAPGKEAVKKVYPHAVHIVEGTDPKLGDSMPLTAAHAIDEMVERVTLNLLRDLQREGKLE